MANEKEIIKILKSGEFTFAFNDSYYGDLIPKKVKSYEEYAKYLDSKGAVCYEIQTEGYGDGLVDYLIQALGGVLEST